MAVRPRCPSPQPSPQPALDHCPGETVSDDDLSQRDLSAIDDSNLSPQERRELQRRYDEFVDRLRVRAGLKGPGPFFKKYHEIRRLRLIAGG